MHLITFIQPTDEWSDLWIRKAFLLELFLLAFSYPLLFLCIYLLIYTKQYHPNLSIMMRHLFIQYPFQMVARITLIIKMLTEDTEKLKTDVIFMVASCIRTYLIFLAFYFSLWAMIERSFATFYLKDYENHQRKYIGWILTVLLHLVSYTSASLFVFEIIPLWPILVSFIISNLVAFFICHINSFLNKKKLKDIVLSKCTGQYNLSERYQLAENIAVATLFKKGIVLFIFFSLLCCSFMSAEEIEYDVYLRNWMHVSFNLSAAIYGIVVPLALFHYNEEWKKGAKRLWSKVSRYHEVIPDDASRPSRDSLATAQKATELYFAQLAKDWGPPHK